MNYWIFVVTDLEGDFSKYSAEEIFLQRMNDKFWGLGVSAKGKENLSENDRVIFYLAMPHKSFVGEAVLDSDFFTLNKNDKELYGHGNSFYESDFGVRLREIKIWEKRVKIEMILQNLKFISNKEYYGLSLKGSFKKIKDEDFELILNSSK